MQKGALVTSTTDTLKKSRLRDSGQPEPGLVALYDIRPGNGAGLFLQPRSLHMAIVLRNSLCVCGQVNDVVVWGLLVVRWSVRSRHHQLAWITSVSALTMTWLLCPLTDSSTSSTSRFVHSLVTQLRQLCHLSLSNTTQMAVDRTCIEDGPHLTLHDGITMGVQREGRPGRPRTMWRRTVEKERSTLGWRSWGQARIVTQRWRRCI